MGISDYNDPTQRVKSEDKPEMIEGEFDEWEKQGYSSFSKKIKDSSLNTSQRKELESFFKEEMIGGKTRSNSQILSTIKKKYGSGTAMKIKSALTPKIKNELSDRQKRINVILGRQASELRDNKKAGRLSINDGDSKKLSSRPKVGFGGYKQEDKNNIKNKNLSSSSSNGSINPLS